MQTFQQNYAPPRFQGSNQGFQKRTHNFEEQILGYMAEKKRSLNIQEHKFAEIAIFQENTIVF